MSLYLSSVFCIPGLSRDPFVDSPRGKSGGEKEITAFDAAARLQKVPAELPRAAPGDVAEVKRSFWYLLRREHQVACPRAPVLVRVNIHVGGHCNAVGFQQFYPLAGQPARAPDQQRR